MHTHVSFWKDGQTLMFDARVMPLSELASIYIGGVFEARAGDPCFCSSDDELVPASRSGLRGAYLSGVLWPHRSRCAYSRLQQDAKSVGSNFAPLTHQRILTLRFPRF
jgi:hypothetical protein